MMFLISLKITIKEKYMRQQNKHWIKHTIRVIYLTREKDYRGK
jgi:hypothetical protein